ncbi:cysteine/serine-rich nuclear protein 1 isoform 2-T3 [Menidia menidia]
MRGALKRKLDEDDEKSPCSSSSSSSPSSPASPASSGWESEGDSGSSGSQHFSPRRPASPSSLPVRSILKRPGLTKGQSSVCFGQVTVFSFPRCQGFSSVPGRGGASLGMAWRHSALRRFTVAEHALERRRRRRQRRTERLRQDRMDALTQKPIESGAAEQPEAGSLPLDRVLDEDADGPGGDSEQEDGGSLQPFSSKQRQALLQAAGVTFIDREEKRQLHALRLSRGSCGCDCQGFCEPETCACNLAGIGCQVDRFNFPCGCTKENCGNTQGCVQFDSRHVRTHYIHTAMRLELERRLQEEGRGPGVQTGLPEELHEHGDEEEAHRAQSAGDKRCPFGFTLEEDGLPLTMPAAPAFHFIPERLAGEENSCCSDTTESSCSSSDSDAGAPPSGGSNGCLTSDTDELSCVQPMDTQQPLTQHSSSSELSTGVQTASALPEDGRRAYLDENANQSRDFFDDDSLEDFPNTPSPTVDYSLGRYMDLSLSSDSDLEFFDSDYPIGPLCSFFKEHRHSGSFQPLQLFSSVNLPQYESSTRLLESLIGLT